MLKNNTVNLFIVGAAKSGTTSLYKYLNKHPDIYMCPIKEPNYFCKDIRVDKFTQKYFYNYKFNIDKYLNKKKLFYIHNAIVDEFAMYTELFKDVSNEIIIGEASTSYLYSKVAASEIKNYNPDAKIIIILRNPVERAFSHWKMNYSLGIENSSFVKAVLDDYKIEIKGWGRSHLYIELGLYSNQIKKYIQLFPSKNLLIINYNDFKENVNKVLNIIYSFLDIINLPIQKNIYSNVSKLQKFPGLTRFVRTYSIKRFIPKQLHDGFRNILIKNDDIRLSQEDHQTIYTIFKNEIENLESLVNCNLDNWKI